MPYRAIAPGATNATVFLQREEILRQELRALSPDHLRTIGDVYDLESAPSFSSSGSGSSRDDLIATIMAAVKRRSGAT